MVDGVGSVDAVHLLLDPAPEGRGEADLPHPDEPPPEATRLPDWVHGPAALALRGARASANAALHPRETARQATAAAELVLRNEVRAAPACSLNVPTTGRRRYAAAEAELSDVRAIARATGTTVNDVVLTVVAGGLRRLLLGRGETPPAGGLRAMVPVNVRREDEHDGRLGNRVSSLFVELPAEIADPRERLAAVHERAQHHKDNGQALGASTIVALSSFAPPVLHMTLARSLYATRLFNVTVTNVPGPQVPLYALGARMRRTLPLVPLAAEHAIGVAIVSYDGTLFFGVIADYDAVGDLEVAVGGLRDELTALGDAIRA